MNKGLEPLHAGGQPLHLPPQLLVRLPQLGFEPSVNGGLPSPRGVVWEVRVKLNPEFLPQTIVTPVEGVGGHKGCHLCQHLHMYRLHSAMCLLDAALARAARGSKKLKQSLMTSVVVKDVSRVRLISLKNSVTGICVLRIRCPANMLQARHTHQHIDCSV